MCDDSGQHVKQEDKFHLKFSARRMGCLYWATVLAILFVSVALRAPALRANLFADDWDHYAMEQQIYPVKVPVWDMFNWVGGEQWQRTAMLRSGRVPWWASNNVQLSVFRPLASVLTHFDYATLDGVHHPNRLHLHTLCWWILLLLGVAALMQSLFPQSIAVLSVLLYAVDDAHNEPFAWAANRSAIIALAFVVWAIFFHVRAERSQSVTQRVVVASLVAVGLAAGEHALAPLAFIPAVSMCGAGPLGPRLRPLIPLGFIVAAYLILRASLGYGIAGSGFYIDPVTEPLRYLELASTRIPVLLGELAFSLPAEWWHRGLPTNVEDTLRHFVPLRWLTDGLRVGMIATGTAGGLLTVFAIRRLRIVGARSTESALPWLLVGGLLSLVPLAGTIVLSRLTLVPALAFDAAQGYLLYAASAAVVRATSLSKRLAWAGLAALVAIVALVVPADRSRDGAHYMHGATNLERRRVEQADFGVESLEGRRVFVLSTRDFASQFSIPYVLHAMGRSMPDKATLLSPVWDAPQILTRTDEQTFELDYPSLSTRFPLFNGSVYRAEADVFRVGEEIASDDFAVRVRATVHDQPCSLTFSFNRSLDDPSLVFMVAGERQLERFSMPHVGETKIIAPADAP